jgi:outer membrane receptor protein involved in Fe transport
MRITYFVLVAVLLLSLGSGGLFAQVTATATIQGTVLDASQAAVSGAQVVAKNKGTEFTRTTTTNDAGYYRFELLPVGTYSVSASKAGFKTYTVSVEIMVGQTLTANAELKVGSASEVVEVTAETPLIEQEKTSVSQNITPSEVEQLPLLGRDVANLAYLAPGVKAADSYDPTKNRYAILSVNGSGGRNVNVTVNGVDNKDNTVGGPVMQLPLEAVQEFQISTQRFSAENGRSEGAAINMITKSGTNSYHGSLFSFFRASALNTEQKVPDGHGGYTLANPDYSRQFFGGSIGGPILKEKLFGFFAIERQRESQGLAESGNSYNELVLAQQAGLAAQPALVIPTPFYETRYSARGDWTINKSNSAYISFNSQVNNSENDQSNGTGDLTNGNYTKNHLQLANFTLNSILSNNAVNQFTFGWQYWNNLIASNISAPLVVFPSASFGTNTNVPQQSFQKKWQFKDDFSKTIGRHTLKGGVDFIYNPVEGGFFEFSSTLEIDFAADPSTILNSPTTYPQGFSTPGAVTGMAQANGDPYFLVATKQLGLYAQDDWKVNRRLTLNLGLRWDKDFNMIGGSDIKDSRTYQILVAANDPLSNPYVSSIAHDDNYDFSPRVGFAYDVTGQGRHILRGGFGLYYGNIFQNIPLFMEQMANPTIFQTVLSLSSPSDPVPGTGLTLGQWRYGVSPLPTIPPPSTTLATRSVGRLMDPHYRNPVTEEFNFGYSWALNANSVIEAEYIHVLSLHENKTINIDQKLPDTTKPVGSQCCYRPLDRSTGTQFASVRNDEAVGRSRYDGINFSYRQRMAHHFTLNANYTLAWAYGYSTLASGFRNYPALSTDPWASYNWGPTPNDERHHVTVSGLVDLPWGFQFAPILQFGSARPYATPGATGVVNSSNTLNLGGGTYIYPVVVPKNNPTDYFAFAPSNFGDSSSAANTAAQNCFYGINGVAANCTIAKYDPLRGDPFFELDLKLAKNFKLGEHVNLQLIAQAFNLTNRANYGNDFGNSIASPDTFGHPVGFINPTSTTTPRSLWSEFGFRLSF